MSEQPFSLAELRMYVDSDPGMFDAAVRLALVEAVEAAHEYMIDQWVALGTDDSRARAKRLRTAFGRFDFGDRV